MFRHIAIIASPLRWPIVLRRRALYRASWLVFGGAAVSRSRESRISAKRESQDASQCDRFGGGERRLKGSRHSGRRFSVLATGQEPPAERITRFGVTPEPERTTSQRSGKAPPWHNSLFISRRSTAMKTTRGTAVE